MGHMAAENVELVALDADRITDDVAIGTEPSEIFTLLDRDAAGWPDPRRHARHWHDTAPGHHLGKARPVGTEMLGADRRAESVGSDHNFGLDLAAVGEARDRGIVVSIGAGAIAAQMKRRIADRPTQQPMEIGAMCRH